MNKFKRYALVILTFFAYESFGQALDSNILSQLTPEQIEMAQELYEDSEILNTADQELSDFEESLVAKPPKNEAVIEGSLLKKYGYDFFSFMRVTTSCPIILNTRKVTFDLLGIEKSRLVKGLNGFG